MKGLDARALSGVVVVCGHYGVGKTALSMALARDAAAAGKRVCLIDLDIVNPYFRSSDRRGELQRAGVSVVSPVYAGSTCNIDMPSLSGAIVPAVEAAQAGAGDQGGSRDPGHPGSSGALAVIDVGGDDAGAFALGRFSRAIACAPYEMLYVVNRYRALTQTPEQAVGVLADIEAASRLRATGVVNNSHLMSETTAQTVAASVDFACAAAKAAGVPLAAHVVPSSVADALSCEALNLARATAPLYLMQPYRQTPWSGEKI